MGPCRPGPSFVDSFGLLHDPKSRGVLKNSRQRLFPSTPCQIKNRLRQIEGSLPVWGLWVSPYLFRRRRPNPFYPPFRKGRNFNFYKGNRHHPNRMIPRSLLRGGFIYLRLSKLSNWCIYSVYNTSPHKPMERKFGLILKIFFLNL